MRANMLAIVCMGIAALAGVVGFLVDRNWILLALGCVCLVGCVSALVSRRKMSSEEAAGAGSRRLPVRWPLYVGGSRTGSPWTIRSARASFHVVATSSPTMLQYRRVTARTPTEPSCLSDRSVRNLTRV